MAAVLKKALQDLYQAGEIFTFLMPASEQIYEPFDFRTVLEQERPYVDSVEGWMQVKGSGLPGSCGCGRQVSAAEVSGICRP